MPRVPSLIVALALSGCVAPPDAPAADPALPDVPEVFEVQDCSIQEIILGVPASSLAPYLPEGHEVEPLGADGLAQLIALAMRCEAPEELTMGWIIVPVRVPEAQRLEGADAHAIVTAIVTEKGERTPAILEAWGYGPVMSRGAIGLEYPLTAARAEPPSAGRATVEGEGGAQFAIDTVLERTRTDPGNLIRFFMVDAGRILGAWDANLTVDHRVDSGQARLTSRGFAPLPEGESAGLGFHEYAGRFSWTRVALPP